MRVALAAFHHRTNSFAAGAASLALSGAMPDATGADATTAGVMDLLSGSGIETVALPRVSAPVGPPLAVDAFEEIAVGLRDGLAGARPDAVILDLGGAGLLGDGRSADLEVARGVRAAIGADRPLVVVLGPEALPLAGLRDVADLVLAPGAGMATPREVGARAAEILLDRMRGAAMPVSALHRLPLLMPPQIGTAMREVLHGIGERVTSSDPMRRPLAIGVTTGFAFADHPELGCGVVAVTDGDAGLADDLAGAVAERIWAERGALLPAMPTLEEAIHAAMLEPEESGPVWLRDGGDDPTLGGSGDGTAVLWALLDLGAPDALLIGLVDTAAVAAAIAAGVGETREITLGGASGEVAGYPLAVRATVGSISEDANGRSVLLACEGRHERHVAVIVTARPGVHLARELLDAHGVDPRSRRIIAIKGAVDPALVDREEGAVLVATPGPTSPDLRLLPYRRVSRPVWPLDRG